MKKIFLAKIMWNEIEYFANKILHNQKNNTEYFEKKAEKIQFFKPGGI